MKIKFSYATLLDCSDLNYYDEYIKNLPTNWWLKTDEVIDNEYISRVFYISEKGWECYDTYNWNSNSWGELSREKPRKKSIVASIRPVLVLESTFSDYQKFLIYIQIFQNWIL